MNFGAFMGMAPSITGQAGAVAGEYADKGRKEGIANMLKGIGKQQDGAAPSLRPLPQQGFDLGSLLASLFGPQG